MEVENNKSRINDFIAFYDDGENLPEDDIESIDLYREASKLTPIIKSCVFSDAAAINSKIVNSNGELEELNVLVSFEKIQEFVYPFIMGNNKYTKEEYSYFLEESK